jgi:hypothetical protein
VKKEACDDEIQGHPTSPTSGARRATPPFTILHPPSSILVFASPILVSAPHRLRPGRQVPRGHVRPAAARALRPQPLLQRRGVGPAARAGDGVAAGGALGSPLRACDGRQGGQPGDKSVPRGLSHERGEQDRLNNPQRYTRSQYLLNAPPGHVFDVIANGYGAMYSYGERVSPEDRWAVTAYVRVLQQAKLAGTGRPAAMPTTLPGTGGTTRRPAAGLPPGETKRVQ